MQTESPNNPFRAYWVRFAGRDKTRKGYFDFLSVPNRGTKHNTMDFIIKWLASFFAAFKAKNPAVAAVIMVILTAAIATVESGQLYGVIPVTGWVQEVIKYVGLFLLAVTGSETWQYLQPGAKASNLLK